MSDSISKLIGYIFIAAIFGVLAVLIAVPQAVVERSIDMEEQRIVDEFGDDTSAKVFGLADQWYNAIFVKTGVKSALFSMYTPTSKQVKADAKMSKMGEGFFNLIKSRLYTLFSVLYIGFVRIVMLIFWLPVLAPLMFASLYDGVQKRKVRMLTFQALSARVFGLSHHAMAVIAMAPLLYLVWPFSVNPMIIPGLLLCSCILLREMASNYQR